MSSYIAFPIQPPLHQKALTVIADLRQDAAAKPNRKALLNVINELADEGIDHFFLQSLRHAGVNFLKIKTAEVGLHTFKRGLQPLLKGFVNGMSDAQILKILDFMEGIMIETEEE